MPTAALRTEFRPLLEACRGLTGRQTGLRTIPSSVGRGCHYRSLGYGRKAECELRELRLTAVMMSLC